MFNNFGFIGSKILKDAEEERYSLSHPYVGSEHLLLAILKSDTDLKVMLEEYNLTYKKFREELINIVGIPKKNIEVNLYTPLLKRILSNAIDDAKENNKGNVTAKHLFLALLDEGEGIAIRIMIGMNIDLDDLYDELKIRPSKSVSNKLEVFNIGSNMMEKIENLECVIGRDKEINMLIEVLLRKKKSNPLLIGPAGVGKTAIVEELARRIKEKNVPSELEDKIIVELSMGDLVSGTKYRGEFEERLTKIIKEVIKNKNIILFIDEVHSMVNAGGAEGAINASDILKPYLARGNIKVIGATTTREYEKFIEKDKALERRFEAIVVNEPTIEETKEILLGLKDCYELHHKIKITDENINDIVQIGNKYLFKKKNPDKVIDLLDSVCAYVKRKNVIKSSILPKEKELEKLINEKEKYVIDNSYDLALDTCLKINELEESINKLKNINSDIILKEDILKVIETKSNIPMFINKEKTLENIKNRLQSKIFGESNAISKILNNMNIYFNKDNGLKLLLVGPSGVGKTSSVKLISEELKSNLIRLDMSEYNLENSVNKLIGSPHGYVGYDDGYIFSKVKYNPYSIILVDEIEKAHPSVQNLFLTIMDEGYVNDNKGDKIDFSHSLIFMTSNAIKNVSVGFNNQEVPNLNEFFSEEFLGRFDDVIYFDRLSKEQVLEYLKENIKNKDVDYEEILKEIKYQEYGFRNINRVVDKYNYEVSI